MGIVGNDQTFENRSSKPDVSDTGCEGRKKKKKKKGDSDIPLF